MNTKEFIDFLNNTIDQEEEENSLAASICHGNISYSKSIRELIKETGWTFFKEEDSYGGEGQGDEYWQICSFINPQNETVYLKFQGYYQSYNGAEYQNTYEVKPVDKVVTDWQGVK